MKTRYLDLNDQLPLTCTRAGTCCFGKTIWVNPWELRQLAMARAMSVPSFREAFTSCGGIRLKLVKSSDSKTAPACSQYEADGRCSVYESRPLACRLYPLGRQRQSEQVSYFYRGGSFPCLAGCTNVTVLPWLSVDDYLKSQTIDAGVASQDGYLELVQDLGEQALVAYIEGGLAEAGDRQLLQRWRRLGLLGPDERSGRIPAQWLDALTMPNIAPHPDDPAAFVAEHRDALNETLQPLFQTDSLDAVRESAYLLMIIALQLAQSVGAEVGPLAETWIKTAEAHRQR